MRRWKKKCFKELINEENGSEVEVRAAMESMKSGKVVGPGDIPVEERQEWSF